jgi:hypothetical protein
MEIKEGCNSINLSAKNQVQNSSTRWFFQVKYPLDGVYAPYMFGKAMRLLIREKRKQSILNAKG